MVTMPRVAARPVDPSDGQLQALPLSELQNDAGRCRSHDLIAKVPASDVDDGHLVLHGDVPVAADVTLEFDGLQHLRALNSP